MISFPQMGTAGLRGGTSQPFFAEREARWRKCLENVASGDTQAINCLYEDTAALLYSIALRILGNQADAEEVLLDVFEQVWRSARNFDPARGTVWRWLVLLTRSRAVDRLRVSEARRDREQPVISARWAISSEEKLPDQASIFSQQQSRVRRALSALPDEQRRAIELAYFSEYTHSEIAALLDVPLGTIKTRIRAGMDKLRAALSDSVSSSAGRAQ